MTTTTGTTLHSCPLCWDEAVPERCPRFTFDWETEAYQEWEASQDAPTRQERLPIVGQATETSTPDLMRDA